MALWLLALMELAVLWAVLPWRYEYLATSPLQGRCVSLAGWSSPYPFTLTSVPGPQAALALTAAIAAAALIVVGLRRRSAGL